MGLASPLYRHQPAESPPHKKEGTQKGNAVIGVQHPLHWQSHDPLRGCPGLPARRLASINGASVAPSTGISRQSLPLIKRKGRKKATRLLGLGPAPVITPLICYLPSGCTDGMRSNSMLKRWPFTRFTSRM